MSKLKDGEEESEDCRQWVLKFRNLQVEEEAKPCLLFTITYLGFVQQIPEVHQWGSNLSYWN
ncbi:hypothetical protein C5167_009734 [Papaver somniferum]|uniref:Uncharacterized protein n=1 Tax=Papaver somniferum TaxID=3469 RepID=A0A4Y7JZQ2_PAPSO|nr:hypothetical protein C5167_009734 [Papaver somniferum]